MSPSRLFILRPVATSLLMAAIMLVGMVAYRFLPLSALPEVDYPTIQVQRLHLDRRVIDLGQGGKRQETVCDHADQHDRRHQQRGRHRPQDEEPRRAHGLIRAAKTLARTAGEGGGARSAT